VQETMQPNAREKVGLGEARPCEAAIPGRLVPSKQQGRKLTNPKEIERLPASCQRHQEDSNVPAF
jgi:hypothetical protein